MTIVIKGGTIVTADLTYKADILIAGDTIAAMAWRVRNLMSARCAT